MESKITVLCTRLQYGYRLTYSLHIKPLPIDQMIRPQFREGIIERLLENIGWWVGRCVSHSIKIIAVELILPPSLEYANLEKELTEFFKEEKIAFSFAIGMKINIEDEEGETSNEEAFDILNGKNTNLN